MLGRLDEALTIIDAGYEEVRAVGLALSEGVLLQVTAAECELRLGRWDAAAARLERLLERTHDDELRLAAFGYLTAIRARQGDFAAAEALEREATPLLAANVAPQTIVSTNTARAEFARLRGDPEAARAIVCDTHETIRWGGIICYPSMLLVGVQAEADLAERARAAGDADDAERACRSAERLLGSPDCMGSLLGYGFESPVGDPAPPETGALHAQAEAELARLNGVPRAELWARAAAQWERLDFPYPAADARLREAEARLAAGSERASRGGRAPQRARDARPPRRGAAARGGRDARAASADRADGAREPAERPFDLTDRELTVLERLAAGRTNRQIAERALPEHAHGRHARAQHPPQARRGEPRRSRQHGAPTRARQRYGSPAVAVADPAA